MFSGSSLVGELLAEFSEERIRFMNDSGVAVQVLSYVDPFDERSLWKNERTKSCVKSNDFLKSVVDKFPSRFLAFACLPLWDVALAVRELERCVLDMGFKGALVTGKVDGHFLDEKIFCPLFEKAAELDVPISFHPSMPAREILDYYYTSRDGSWSDEVANEFGSAGFGWHLDIGIQVLRMILSGIFDKFPNLQFIVGHWGEGIISMLDRIDYMMPPRVTGLRRNVSEYYKRNIYVTPSGIASVANLEMVVKYMGADRIIWSVDYPYIRDVSYTGFLLGSDLTGDEKELISHKNAERLFKMM